MKQTAIAERYTEALFDIAREQRLETRFGGILDDIAALMHNHPDFTRLLHSPVVKAEDKKAMLKQLFEGQIPTELLHFLFLLVDRKRESCLHEIILEYRRLLNLHNQTLITEVTTAVPMMKKTQLLLQKQLEDYLGKKVEMTCETDAALLGGVTVRIGDRMIDGSLRTQLRELTQTLVSQS
ncbi:MAG: ATP synthase F1 subunit delta [Candidatus Sericytochromatia bacterium]